MITNTTAKMTYTAVSGVTQYAIGFVYNTNPDGSPQIKVYLNKASNTPLVYGTDYTITPDGLYVDITATLEVGDRIDIIRDIPMVQLSDYIIGRIDPEQIENDMDAAVMRDQQLNSDLQFVAEVPLDHEARIQECESDIDDIESLVPAQATDVNQLADKEFVNSSIATSTATFKGTYSSLAELEEVTADDNDYGFVVSTDAAGNTLYSRYKYANGSWAFEYNLNNSSFTAEQWAAINSGITAGIVDTFNATGHNIGDIFYTMRNDNELNGAVECDGSSYNTTDFTGAQSIGQLLSAGKVPYVSLSAYATRLAQYGSVGVFGWDGLGTTAFKVPTLTDIFVETGTAAQVGNYLAPGLPDHSHTLTIPKTQSNNVGNGTTRPNAETTETATTSLASTSNSIYGNSNTVQPNAVRYRAMVQLAVVATDEALETCTNVLSDVAGLKARSVKFATYGVTTYQEVRDWIDNGAMVFVENVGNVGNICALDVDGVGQATFTRSDLLYNNQQSPIGVVVQRVQVKNNDTWTASGYTVQGGHEVIKFQAPTAQNNYTWYRKYADGWVEQGGKMTAGGTTTAVTLAVEMSDTEYLPQVTQINSSTAVWNDNVRVVYGSQTTTGFNVYTGSTNTDNGFVWEVKGMAANN